VLEGWWDAMNDEPVTQMMATAIAHQTIHLHVRPYELHRSVVVRTIEYPDARQIAVAVQRVLQSHGYRIVRMEHDG
jgi:hypothetical protein